MKTTAMKTTATILALLLALPACGQQRSAPKQATKTTHVRAANDADPALWVVKDKDTTVYLFGTIHVLKPGLSWFDEAVKTAFDRSDTLALEMVEPDKATAQGIITAKGLNPTGPTLTERLPANKRAAYTRTLTDLGLPANALDRMKPWYAAMNLSLLPIMKMGYDPAQGPETVLTAAAKASGKKVAALETFEQQIGFFDGLSPSAQTQFLLSTVDEVPKAGEEMSKMVDEWSRGDPDALARDMNDSLKDSPEVAKTLLTDRNARWAKWIENRMKTPGTVFVAVGAGHLAGPQSVQAHLMRDKVKVSRIRY
ncbi:hypothetical protein SAMN05192583_0402 [Sphingomonas gellani]|uniref:TraB family protein n=1 Tax=Sphingomonas gellani TaxID=1166340 RepID=A0A1H7YVU7_9SPHN|nr:TraB/GumN family protein [Sphingomonas gellani]SEM49488.1 hypothetical protein SAMN05192583_0402 [Sphingomonas gellani]